MWPATRGSGRASGAIHDGRSGIDDLEHALDGAGPLAELAVQARDAAEAAADRDAVQQEPGQRADPERAVDDLVPREPQQRGDRAEAQEPHERPEPRPPQRETRARRDHAAQVGVVALELPLLAHVALDDADPRQRLLGRRRAPRDRVLDLGADPLQRSTEHDRDRDERRRQEQHDEQQRRAEGEQDDHRPDEPDERRQEARDGLRQHRAHERHVARQARDELADAMCAVEVERQRDEPPVQLATELRHDPLPHHAEQVGLDEAAHGLHAEQRDEHDDQPIEPVRVAAGDDRGRDAGDDQRKGEAEGGREDEPDQRDRERPPVRAEIAEQPPPRHAAEAADLAHDGAGIGRDARELLGHALDDGTGWRESPPAARWAAETGSGAVATREMGIARRLRFGNTAPIGACRPPARGPRRGKARAAGAQPRHGRWRVPMKRLLALAAALVLLVALPMSASAARAARFTDHFVGITCDGPESTSGGGFVFFGANASDEFEPDAFVDYWTTDEPEGNPDLIRDFDQPVDVTWDGSVLAGSIPLIDLSSGDPAGSATFSATLVPTGDPEPFEDEFRDGNHQGRFTGVFQAMDPSGSLTVGDSTFTLDGCFAEETTVTVFETNPRSFVTHFTDRSVDCDLTNADGDTAFFSAFLEDGQVFIDAGAFPEDGSDGHRGVRRARR